MNDDVEICKNQPVPRNLEAMSIDALNSYIAELKLEVERVRLAITAKERAHDVAKSIFKQ